MTASVQKYFYSAIYENYRHKVHLTVNYREKFLQNFISSRDGPEKV